MFIITMFCFPLILFVILQTYFGVEVDTIKEPVHRQATITMIKTYGQTPKQLFEKAPHPEPGTSQSVISQLFVSSSSSNPVSTVETRMYIVSCRIYRMMKKYN